MSANISNVINVQLLEGGALAARDNFNVVTIITSQQDGPLSSANRFEIYTEAAPIAEAFGTASEIYSYATAFFGTSPNPVSAGGYLIVGYWRAASENVAASAATLTGTQLSEANAVGQLQSIQDGSFDIDVDGVTENITGLDFRFISTLQGAVDLIDTALAGATASIDDQKVIITSDTTGATSTLTNAVAAAGGTFIGDILTLSAGSGAVLVQGAAAAVLALETKLEAVTELKSLTNFKGGMFIDNPTDVESKDLAEWAQANNTLMYDVFNADANLDIDPANVVWDIKLSSLTNYRMLFSKANNRKMAASYMARTHVVNFNAINSALTMNLKTLSVAAEDYSQSEINAAKAVGLDIYTTIKLTPVVLTSGANDFVDNRYNLLAYVDAVQTDLFNVLKGTSTKIAQTTAGVQKLIDQSEKTTRNFVTAGVFAAGTWSSPDSFGDLDTFNRNISDNGFYWLAGSLAEQPQSDRELRKSPVLQGAVKLAGAIHSADIIINVNK
jgi:hypothetical protein